MSLFLPLALLLIYMWVCPTAASRAHPLFVVALVEEHVFPFLLLRTNRCLLLTFFSNQRRVSDVQKWFKWEWKLSAWFYEQKQKTTDVTTLRFSQCVQRMYPDYFNKDTVIWTWKTAFYLSFSCPSPSPVLTAQIIRPSFSCRLVRYLGAWKYSSVDPQLLSAVIKSRNAAWFILIKPFIKLNNSRLTWEEGNCTFFFSSNPLKISFVKSHHGEARRCLIDTSKWMNSLLRGPGYIFFTSLLWTSVISIMNTAASPDRLSSRSDIHRGKWWY